MARKIDKDDYVWMGDHHFNGTVTGIDGGGDGSGVSSVNGLLPDGGGNVELDASDIGAIAEGDVKPSDLALSGSIYRVPVQYNEEWLPNGIVVSGTPTANRIPLYFTGGVLRVSDPVGNLDAVNLQTMLSAISSVYKYKGSVADEASLPPTGNTTGDVWNTEETGMNFAWTGTEWDALATTVDLSAYYTKTEVDGMMDLDEGDFLVGGASGNEKRGLLPTDLGLTGASNNQIPYRASSNTFSFVYFSNAPNTLTLVSRTSTGQGKFMPAINADEAVVLSQAQSLIDGEVITVSANKTLALTDRGTYQNVTVASTITVPPNASVAFPVGSLIQGFGQGVIVTIAAGAGVTIHSKGSILSTVVDTAWTLKKVATDVWHLIGDLQ